MHGGRESMSKTAHAAVTITHDVGLHARPSVKLTQTPAEANVKAVTVTLPLQLGVRLDNLQHACPEETFEAAGGTLTLPEPKTRRARGEKKVHHAPAGDKAVRGRKPKHHERH